MQLLIKTALLLTTFFTSTFLIIKLFGWITIEDIHHTFESISTQPSYIIGLVVTLVLFADLFIAIPTMTVLILGAFFLGFKLAFFYALAGLTLAAYSGYFISRIWGVPLLNHIIKDQTQKDEMQQLFVKYGTWILIFSRATPILPELTSCMSGVTRMPLYKFTLGWLLGTIPYLTIVTYAGSISSIDNPYPAIITAIIITLILWSVWMLFFYKKHKTHQ
ncbi:MAG: VTT domain-containing protein [Epsilonproteobacteria bacterium]|nr:VTT domain-containing protein [Campylobacterota bacterium]